MKNFEISNSYFYLVGESMKGYSKIQIEEEVLEYNFEFDFGSVINTDSGMGLDIIIKEMKNIKENKKCSVKETFNEMYGMLSEKNKDDELYYLLRERLFNEYFVYGLEKDASRNMINKFHKEIFIKIKESKIERKKKFDSAFIINCEVTIFDKCFELNLRKGLGYCIIKTIEDKYINEFNSWFLEKNKMFYLRVPIAGFYSLSYLMTEAIISFFKETRYCKMLLLYDNEIEKLLHIRND
jgi:hypothetical protein